MAVGESLLCDIPLKGALCLIPCPTFFLAAACHLGVFEISEKSWLAEILFTFSPAEMNVAIKPSVPVSESCREDAGAEGDSLSFCEHL